MIPLNPDPLTASTLKILPSVVPAAMEDEPITSPQARDLNMLCMCVCLICNSQLTCILKTSSAETELQDLAEISFKNFN